VNKIQAVLGKEIPIHTLFESPTVATLASRPAVRTNINPFNKLLPIRANGTLPPLFFIHPANGLSRCYAGFLKYVEPQRPIYGLQARNFSSSESPTSTMEEITADYLEEIHRIQPTGSYHLAGWSIGGLIAYSIANEIQRRGEHVALISVLDAIPVAANETKNIGNEESYTMLDMAARIFGKELHNEPHNLSSLYAYLHQRGRLPPNFNERHLFASLENAMTATALRRSFVPSIYNGNLMVFVGASAAIDKVQKVQNAWRPFVNGDIQLYPIASTHREMTSPPALSEIGPIFTVELRSLSSAP